MSQPCYNESKPMTLREISERLGVKLNTVRIAASRGCFETTIKYDEHGRPYRVGLLKDAQSHFGKRRTNDNNTIND